MDFRGQSRCRCPRILTWDPVLRRAALTATGWASSQDPPPASVRGRALFVGCVAAVVGRCSGKRGPKSLGIDVKLAHGFVKVVLQVQLEVGVRRPGAVVGQPGVLVQQVVDVGGLMSDRFAGSSSACRARCGWARSPWLRIRSMFSVSSPKMSTSRSCCSSFNWPSSLSSRVFLHFLQQLFGTIRRSFFTKFKGVSGFRAPLPR